MSHDGHGRVECKTCRKVISSCRCLEAGKVVKYVTCPECLAKYDRKMKELGFHNPATDADGGGK